MPNNVYIGSRYVPIFKGVWNATLSYEALTIVEYGNNSFTSKRPVPLNTPPTTGDENDPYWVLTGNYNGQIAHLQDQIDDNTSDITALSIIQNFIERFSNKKFVIYGDSLSSYDYTWVTPFTDLIESIGGTVTNHSSAGDKTADQLVIANNDNTVYDVALVLVGVNDAHNSTPLGPVSDSGTFSNIYYTLINRILTISENCEVYCFGMPYNQPDALKLTHSIYYYNHCIAEAAYFGGACYKTMDTLPNNGYAHNHATSEGTHFTETYSQNTLFYTIVNKLCNPSAEADIPKKFTAEITDILSSITTGVTIESGGSCIINPNGDVHLVIPITVNNITSTTLATIKSPLYPRGTTKFMIDNIRASIGFTTGNINTDTILPNGSYMIDVSYNARWTFTISLSN